MFLALDQPKIAIGTENLEIPAEPEHPIGLLELLKGPTYMIFGFPPVQSNGFLFKLRGNPNIGIDQE
jgi:hypothetical protein